MTENLFTIVGTSSLTGQTKVRWANDLVTRFKMLHKDGHRDINLHQLPTAMTKQQACQWLMQQVDIWNTFTSDQKFAVTSKIEEHSIKGKREMKISLDEIASRPIINASKVKEATPAE